jgi:hypothetical protein
VCRKKSQNSYAIRRRYFGDDPSNPPEVVVPTLERERYYRRVVYLATFIDSLELAREKLIPH